MSQLKGKQGKRRVLAAWLLVPLLGGCASELRQRELDEQLNTLSPDAALELLAQKSQDQPDDLDLRSRYLQMRRQIVDAYIGKASVAYEGGDAEQALEWARDGVDAVAWLRLPKQLAAGDAGGLAAWPLPRLLEALHKLCHDALCLACGAAPRYFPPAAMPPAMPLYGLMRWASALSTASRHGEHPWNQPVMVESLVQQAREALAPPRAGRSPSVHSAR